jgi:hypothetical protein
MLTALDNMKNELMLLGFASLMLMAFQGSISSWCGECGPCWHVCVAACAVRWSAPPSSLLHLGLLQSSPRASRLPPTSSGWTGCRRATAAWRARRTSRAATSSTGWQTADRATTSTAWPR